MHGRYIARTQFLPLADLLPSDRFDGGPAVLRKCRPWVVHDRVIIIGSEVVTVADILAEIVDGARDNVLEVDADEAIPVFAALLMPQSHRMADLMNYIAGGAIAPKVDKLLAPTHAN